MSSRDVTDGHRRARRRSTLVVGALAALWMAAAAACVSAPKVRPLPLGDPADPAAAEAATRAAQPELRGPAAATVTPTATPVEAPAHHHHGTGGGQ